MYMSTLYDGIVHILVHQVRCENTRLSYSIECRVWHCDPRYIDLVTRHFQSKILLIIIIASSS